MKIRIGTKMTIGFMLIILLMVVMSYYSFVTSGKYLQDSIGKKSIIITQEILRSVDKRIYYLLDDIQLHFSNHESVLDLIEKSNRQFDNMDNKDEYIDKVDREWIASKDVSPIMNGIIYNDFSEHLRKEFISFYEEKYKYKIFTEVFITNKYGVNISQTGRTTDYRQDDENWWQVAKEKGTYLSDYEYDESSNTYGIGIAQRLNDKKGNFAGVIKAIVAADGIIKDAELDSKKYETAKIHLLTNDGKTIYETEPIAFIDDSAKQDYFSRLKGQEGYFITKLNGNKRLFSFTRSKGYRNFNAFNWLLVVCYDLEEVFKPTYILKSNLFSAAVLLIVGGFIIAVFVSRFITGPISKLAQGTEIVGTGILDHKIDVKTSDEIGELAGAFNYMTENLKKITTSRDEMNKEIAEREKAEEELKKHRENLMEMVAERTLDLQNINDELEDEIADRTKAEKQVKLMALFAELNPSPVLRFDANGKILMANQAASEILGDGFIMSSTLQSIIPELKEVDFSDCIKRGAIISYSVQIKERYFNFIFKGIPVMNFGQIYGSDITERKLAETEALRTSQLASLGELAAGVAHEINNPVNGIINLAQILVNKSPVNSKEQDIAGRIIREGDRIAVIVRSLLSFARENSEEKQPVILNEIIDESLALFGTTLKKDMINLKVNIPRNLPPVFANPQQIEQVFLNVLSNARFSLNQKNENNDKDLEIYCEMVTVGGSSKVRTIFHDKGIGIPKDIIDKLVNPFFTTKPCGSGTGLGLSISHNIISNHSGSITFESHEGEFTKVIIDLPVAT